SWPRRIEHHSLCSATGMPHSTQTRTLGFGGSSLPRIFLKKDMPASQLVPDKFLIRRRSGEVPGWRQFKGRGAAPRRPPALVRSRGPRTPRPTPFTRLAPSDLDSNFELLASNF